MSHEQRDKLNQRAMVLVARLRSLETKQHAPHEKPIVEVGILALREKIRDIGLRLAR